MEVFEAIKGRRSIRKYESGSVPDELIERILEAGQWAPTAGNIQPWKFIVVKDPKILDMFERFHRAILGMPPSLLLYVRTGREPTKWAANLVETTYA